MEYDDIIGAFTNDDDYMEEDEVQKSNEDKTIFFTKVNNVVNKDIDKWIRPWELEKFDDLYNRDERFFAILVKGLLSWLNRNIVLYNKSINHFIFNTGSSYMYVESNGYEYVWCETTGEDQIYMHMPRCLVELGSIDILLEELSQPFSRGNYERNHYSDEELKKYFDVVCPTDVVYIPVEYNGKSIFCCHYPMREWPGFYKGHYHAYGHVHSTLSQYRKSIDVGVDNIGIKPIEFEALTELIDKGCPKEAISKDDELINLVYQKIN